MFVLRRGIRMLIRKPVTDTREYRHITLGNKLEALLISDSSADKSAAAMDVRVGSLFDPPQLQGLAHFLEHMLFLGTDKFPNEDEYQSYLARHGGMSNAFTADNHTCYFFNVAPEHLEGALDRFGQFFISPLFTQSATDREINAVHSEHSKNVQEDMWRQYQLMRTICFDPHHPAHHFSTGNKETLGNVPRSALLNFHKSWYSANVSRLAVLGKDSLDDLESMVRKIFSDMENKDVNVPLGTGFSKDGFKYAIQHVVEDGAGIDTSKLEFPESDNPLSVPLDAKSIGVGNVPTINQSCIGKTLVIVPVKEQRSLQFCWFIPEQRRLWESKPSRYLSHVLGHEGPGSLTSILKAKGIATDLVGGLFYDNAGVALLKVEVHLTKSATEKLETLFGEIAKTVAAYINLARRNVSRDIWDEMQVVENLNFRFQPTLDPMTSVQTAVNSMHYHPVEEILAGQKMIYKYDENAIRTHLDLLESEKMFLTLVGKEFASKCSQTEKWYGTKYGIEPIPEKVIDAFSRIEQMPIQELERLCEALGLALPKKNPFLPENLNLVTPTNSETVVPERIAASSFFKQDNKFKMPKAQAAFSAYSPFVQGGVENYVGTDMLLQCLNEEHSQVAYQAEVAGLKYKLRSTREGFSLSLGGYSDKISVIAQSVLDELASFKPTSGLFDLVKDRTVRQLQSQLLQKAPYSQAIDLSHQLLLSPYYSIQEKLNQVLSVKSADQLPQITQVLAGSYIESLIQGNVDRAGASALSHAVAKAIEGSHSKPTDQVSHVKVLGLDRDIVIRRKGVNPNETNGAVVVSVEAGWVANHVSESDGSDLKTAALLAITSQICGQKFFDDLRTKQQLGYIVHSSASVQERRAGLLFLVQSEVPTETVRNRIMDFVYKFDTTVEGISPDDFQQYIGAVVADLLEKPKNQEEEFQRHWAEIEKRRFDFTRKDRLIPVVESVTQQELVQFVKDHVINGPKVTTIVTGSSEPDLSELMSDDEIREYKASSSKWVESFSKPLVNDATSKM
jgi:insulysin